TAANDRDRFNSLRGRGQDGPERACVHVDHETLQHPRPQDQPLEPVQTARIEPAEERRPPTLTGAGVTMLRQARPVHAGSRVMLDVITVVEEQQVVDGAVVARCAVMMLVESMNRAKKQADKKSRNIRACEELRVAYGH